MSQRPLVWFVPALFGMVVGSRTYLAAANKKCEPGHRFRIESRVRDGSVVRLKGAILLNPLTVVDGRVRVLPSCECVKIVALGDRSGHDRTIALELHVDMAEASDLRLGVFLLGADGEMLGFLPIPGVDKW